MVEIKVQKYTETREQGGNKIDEEMYKICVTDQVVVNNDGDTEMQLVEERTGFQKESHASAMLPDVYEKYGLEYKEGDKEGDKKPKKGRPAKKKVEDEDEE